MTDFSNLNTPWRKVAAAMYKKPEDSKIFGSVELDVTDVEEYIAQKRKEGLKITLTHLLFLTVARAFREEVPEFNCYVKRGSVVHRGPVTASLSVLMEKGTQMGSVRVENLDTMTLVELQEFLAKEIANSRSGTEQKLMKMKHLMAAVPWPFRGWILGFIKKFTTDWGLSVPALNVNANSFGSFMLSNIGTIGLDMGYPALFPAANVSLVLIVGSVQWRPAVVNGVVVPRRIMHLGAALDHRVVDALHGGKLFRYIKAVFKNPQQLESAPVSQHSEHFPVSK